MTHANSLPKTRLLIQSVGLEVREACIHEDTQCTDLAINTATFNEVRKATMLLKETFRHALELKCVDRNRGVFSFVTTGGSLFVYLSFNKVLTDTECSKLLDKSVQKMNTLPWLKENNL